MYRLDNNKQHWHVAILFTFTTVLFLYGGAFISTGNFYLDAFYQEFLIILLPSVLFIEFLFRGGKRNFLRFNKIKVSNLVLVTFLIIFALPLIGLINNLVYFLISKIFSRTEIYSPPAATNEKELWLAILVVGLVPAICEEFLFRGVIQGALKKYGAWFSILFTGVLFAFLHVDMQSFVGIFILGSFIGFLVYRTNSLFAGVMAHFANNVAATVLTYLASFAQDLQEDGLLEEQYEMIENMDYFQLIANVLMMLFFLVTFTFLLYIFIKNTKDTVEKGREIVFINQKIQVVVSFLPAIIIFVYIYITQAYYLLGEYNSIVDALKQFTGIGYGMIFS